MPPCCLKSQWSTQIAILQCPFTHFTINPPTSTQKSAWGFHGNRGRQMMKKYLQSPTQLATLTFPETNSPINSSMVNAKMQKPPNKDPTSAHVNEDSNEIPKHNAINPAEKSEPPTFPLVSHKTPKHSVQENMDLGSGQPQVNHQTGLEPWAVGLSNPWGAIFS